LFVAPTENNSRGSFALSLKQRRTREATVALFTVGLKVVGTIFVGVSKLDNL